MNRRVRIFTLRFAIAALASGAWMFWRCAGWRVCLQRKLNNFKAADDKRR